MTEDLQYVGGSYPVHDVAQKVTGELVYGSDFSVPGMLHAKLVLSTIPHGMVKQIDASRAEALPGVVKVFSHQNSPMDRFCRARIHPGQDLAPHDETLFSEHVRFSATAWPRSWRRAGRPPKRLQLSSRSSTSSSRRC